VSGEGLAEVSLLILLATRGRNTPKLTTKMGKYVQNQLRVQKINTIGKGGAILLEIGKCSTAQVVCADDMLFSCHCDAVYSCDSIRSLFAVLKLSFYLNRS
jgi:hypothetical protein